MDKVSGAAAGMMNAGINSKQKPLYQVAIFNLPQMSKIRQLRTTGLGRLSAISGTVTRTTDSKPELLIGSFICKECNSTVDNVEQQFKYSQPVRCSNDNCHNKMNWELAPKNSRMIDW